MLRFALFLSAAFAAWGQETEEPQTLVEITSSHDFNYGMINQPVGKGLGAEVQFYWTPKGGSQLLFGPTYEWKPKKIRGLNLIPGAYGVSESCHAGAKPAGCWDWAVGLAWEWKNSRWSTKGFFLHTIQNPELRFGIADPIEFDRRLKGGKWETGLYFVGERAREEERMTNTIHAGWGVKRIWEDRGLYVQAAPLFYPHAGFRLTVGKTLPKNWLLH